MTRDARERILERIRRANRTREILPHPGPLPSSLEPPPPSSGDAAVGPVPAFAERFRASGGEVVRLPPDRDPVAAWLTELGQPLETVSTCADVPRHLRPDLPSAEPTKATLGVCMALGAAAQTGSLLLSSVAGRRPQLLTPVQLVWVRASDVRATLNEALLCCREELEDLPAVLALHSGPSKSADIGQIIVTGVHGPGRIIAAILDEPAGRAGPDPGSELKPDVTARHEDRPEPMS